MSKLIHCGNKPSVRDLTMILSDEKANKDFIGDIRDNIAKIHATNGLPQPHPDITLVERRDSRFVDWQCEGSKFGFTVQRIDARDLLVQDFMGDVTGWPRLFAKGLKLMYLVEGDAIDEGELNAAAAKYSRVFGDNNNNNNNNGNNGNNNNNNNRRNRLTMIVTTGEAELFAELSSIMKKYYPNRSDVVKQVHLNTADISWECDGQQIGLAIESKKAPDLVSGIRDSRNKTQVDVMLHLGGDNSQIAYLHQGNVLNVQSMIDDKAKVGAMTYPIIRYGFRSINVANAKIAAAFLANIHIQMEHAPKDKLKAEKLIFQHGINQTMTKKDLSEEHSMSLLMQTVYGVSAEVGEAIAQFYPNFGALMNAYTIYPLHVETMLKDIPVVSRSGKIHKIGPEVSKAVARKFCIQDIVTYDPKKAAKSTTTNSAPKPTNMSNTTSATNQTNISTPNKSNMSRMPNTSKTTKTTEKADTKKRKWTASDTDSESYEEDMSLMKSDDDDDEDDEDGNLNFIAEFKPKTAYYPKKATPYYKKYNTGKTKR